MTPAEETTARIDALIAAYGTGSDGTCPKSPQWESIFARDPELPITLINFFKLHEKAHYGPERDLGGSGQEAFDRYAAVSIPSMEAVGGKFLMVAPFAGTFAGDDRDWDLIAIGSYPDVHALLTLYENPNYQKAFFHRTAACAAQEVLIASA